MKYKFLAWACLLLLLFAALEVYGWIFGPRYDERAWHFEAAKVVFFLLLGGFAALLITLAVYLFML